MGNSKVKESRVKLLDMQLEAAVVEGPDDDGYFDVFVPGAPRERNRVTGKDEKDAVAKVRTNLISKIDQMPDEATENVEVDPDTLKVTMKGKVNG